MTVPDLHRKDLRHPALLAKALHKARDRTHIMIRDQFEYGVLAVCVPVKDIQGLVVAAVNCASEVTRAKMMKFVVTRVPRLREAAQAIGQALECSRSLIHSIHSEARSA